MNIFAYGMGATLLIFLWALWRVPDPDADIDIDDDEADE